MEGVRAPASQTEIAALFDPRVAAMLERGDDGRCGECGGAPWDVCPACGVGAYPDAGLLDP